ncbi:MAG: branched-chain amino acid ABC transporter permease [Micromonosporaceae bacterium]|nr:branched-chain amino acid ABC transporter permease [Micromonosporaceae bacterium]
MRSIWRTVDPDLARNAAALGAAVFVVGCSFGAIAAAAGLSPWLAVAMSVLVFAGGSQFAAVAIVATGGSALLAAVAGVLLNARHLPFGLAVGDVLGRRWATRLVGSHLMVDENVAYALAESDPRRRRVAYWTTGATLFVSWNIAVPVGAVAGARLGDPAALGLDAAFPAALLALLLPALRNRRARAVAAGGAVIALAATPVLPAGVPVLLALVALPVALFARPAPVPRGDTTPGEGDAPAPLAPEGGRP